MTALSVPRDGSVQSPLLIVVGSGSRVYQEYLLSLMAECARVWLLLDATPTWEKLYITGHTVVDTHDAAAVVETATRLAGWLPVDGVMCLDDARATQSAAAAASLGLPTSGPDTARRERFADEYDLTVDVACVDGEMLPLFVSRRINAVLPDMAGPGHIVDASDPALADENLIAQVAAAHRAVGVRHGVTHARVRHTPCGPRVVSVHLGLSGDLVPYAASLAAGVNPGRVVAQVACGIRPDVTPRSQRVAAVRFFTRPPEVAIGTVQADESRLPLSVDVVEALTDAQPTRGDRSLRYAYSVVVDDSVEGCARALTAAEGAFVPRPRGEFRNDPPADERRPSAVIPHAAVLPDPSAGTVR